MVLVGAVEVGALAWCEELLQAAAASVNARTQPRAVARRITRLGDVARQRHDELAAAVTGLVDPRAASHPCRELPDDREPEAGTYHAARLVADGVEALEHERELVGRNARAVVGDDHRDIARSVRCDVHLDAGFRVLQRVLDQIRDDLREPLRIEIDRQRLAGHDREADTELVGLWRERLRRVPHYFGRVARPRG